MVSEKSPFPHDSSNAEQESGYPTVRVTREGRTLVIDTTPIEDGQGGVYFSAIDTTDPSNLRKGRVAEKAFKDYMERQTAPNPEAAARQEFVPREVGVQAVAYVSSSIPDALSRCMARSELLRAAAAERRRRWGPNAELPPLDDASGDSDDALTPEQHEALAAQLRGNVPPQSELISEVPTSIMSPGLQARAEQAAEAERVGRAVKGVVGAIEDAKSRAGYIDPAVGTVRVLRALDAARQTQGLPDLVRQRLERAAAILTDVNNDGRDYNVRPNSFITAFDEALGVLKQ
ncbi:MAG: hypothetical protein WAQ25_04530 [Candidatus Saccharimonas sp.]